jgi:hypothetical protein
MCNELDQLFVIKTRRRVIYIYFLYILAMEVYGRWLRARASARRERLRGTDILRAEMNLGRFGGPHL